MSDDTPHSAAEPARRSLVLGLVAFVTAALVVYSQIRAFAWDEGFHLLTAQSIGRGKRPYLDFCFPQTPLNAYWNAAWMHLFGDIWRTPHAIAALMTALAVLMTVVYLWRSFPEPRWRTAVALTAACIVGLNIAVFEFGTIGQAYGLCLFLIVSAFLITVNSVDRAGLVFPAAAGFLACAAANSSLLTAPAASVLLVWMVYCNLKGNRWAKLAAFAGGGAVAFAPLAWLFVQGPRQTIFNVIEYNVLYRQRHWDGAVQHNIDQWSAWLDSPQALMLGLLAIAGLLFVKQSKWSREMRRQYYLCGWLAAALMLHISTAVPTFTRYYLLAVPFLAILASAGLYSVGSRLAAQGRPFWPALIVSLITIMCLAKTLYDGRSDFSWSDVERTAAQVKKVTPPQAMLLADENVYFVTRRVPPSGLELADSHKLDFPPDVAAKLHVISQAELDRRIKARTFDTVELSDYDDETDKLGLKKMYAHVVDVEQMSIYWGKPTTSH
jgi:hypothetical protein